MTDHRKRRVPQQSRSRDRVARLLDTASRLVVTDGVDALGTRTIAHAAGVPVASLYQYFADKDEILLALVERDIEEMDARVATGLAEGTEQGLTLEGLVSATVEAFVSVYRERPAFVEIWLRGRGNQSVRDLCREHNRRVAAGLHALACESGLLAAGTPVRVAELAVEIGDRLFQLAFEDSLTGDDAILLEARRAVVGYLHVHAADRSGAGTAAGTGARAER
ncbi:TetR/AcrR family transcriptional regulator [Nocardioides sp. HDW12B]|uniref:TetR/AcrR family transcriptional regulator n=1 Tax=Nocardioides sp. HDW12B TaxID=2714939 RepID=UPI00140E92BC|nr:TetR/AcrR family transcriptional regulator [Nocardioides sp. HDW12B]QIK65265.1 TetR/AcrR family transcriptional regulator [Nocardioides sp. HDW12B]